MKGRLEKAGLIISIAAALLTLINQAWGILSPVFYAPELLLIAFVSGLMGSLSFVIWSTTSRGRVYKYSKQVRALAAVLFLLIPIAGFGIWQVTIRVPREARSHVRSGDIAMDKEDYPFAQDQYEEALKMAPWNVKIKNRLSEAKSRKKPD